MRDSSLTLRCGTIVCDCGKKSDVERKVAQAVTAIWWQCHYCGKLWQVDLPDSDRKARRARANSQNLQDATFAVFRTMDPPLGVRQLFYALETKGIVAKSEAGYRQIQYQLAVLRRRGILPYGWIADGTRWQIKPKTYAGLADALMNWQSQYRHALWAQQNAYVEIWIEKQALAAVISPITAEYDVPLMVARGYSSISFLYDAAMELGQIRKPIYVYQFGDMDPSGDDAAQKIVQEIRDVHGVDIDFEQVAITQEQAKRYKLPTRPTKKTDPRAKKWGDRPSVELDALPAPILRDMVRECIERHLDPEILKKSKAVEAAERATLSTVMKNFVLEQNK